jgi:hypothetical protein
MFSHEGDFSPFGHESIPLVYYGQRPGGIIVAVFTVGQDTKNSYSVNLLNK